MKEQAAEQLATQFQKAVESRTRVAEGMRELEDALAELQVTLDVLATMARAEGRGPAGRVEVLCDGARRQAERAEEKCGVPEPMGMSLSYVVKILKELE